MTTESQSPHHHTAPSRTTRSRLSMLASPRLQVVWALLAAVIVWRIFSTMLPTSVPSDFTQDYLAAQSALHGQSIFRFVEWSDFPPSLQHFQAEIQNRGTRNFHPPFAILLVLPLAPLSYEWAVILWSVFCFACWFASWWLLLRELTPGLSWVMIFAISACTLLWQPVYQHFLLGQVGLPMVVAIIGSWAAQRNNRPYLAGVLLGLACLLKLFPGLLIVALLLRREWRAAISATLTIVVGFALCLLVFGSADLQTYAYEIVPLNVTQFQGYIHNVSLRSAIFFLITGKAWTNEAAAFPAPPLAIWLTNGAHLLLLGLLAVALLRLPRTRQGHDAAFALCLPCMLLLTPASWIHGFIALLPALGLLALALRQHPNRASFLLSTLILLMLSVSHEPLIDLVIRLQHAGLPDNLSILPLLVPTCGLIMLAFLLWHVLATPAAEGAKSGEARLV